MTYVHGNPKTKKAIKDALAAGAILYAFEPGLGKLPENGGRVFLEGPHYPEPHKWYAEAEVTASGRIIKGEVMRSDEELKQIARDIVAGHIFTDRHIRRARPDNLVNVVEREFDDELVADQMRMVFLPLALADRSTLDAIMAHKPALFYEYLDKAMPRSVNGMPCFASVRYITEEEYPKLTQYIRVLEEHDPLKDL